MKYDINAVPQTNRTGAVEVQKSSAKSHDPFAKEREVESAVDMKWLDKIAKERQDNKRKEKLEQIKKAEEAKKIKSKPAEKLQTIFQEKGGSWGAPKKAIEEELFRAHLKNRPSAPAYSFDWKKKNELLSTYLPGSEQKINIGQKDIKKRIGDLNKELMSSLTTPSRRDEIKKQIKTLQDPRLLG